MITWHASKGRFASGEYALSGKVPIGTYHRNSLDGSKDPQKRHYWRLDLPGRDRNGYAPTTEDAKKAVEAAFADWCKAAGLEPK